MEFLTNWITQIIIFILLATIIDLLVPNTGMKRYIKLVIGLVLILILLQPVFTLFNLNIEGSLEQIYLTQFDDEGMIESVKDSIELQKKEIELTQGAYILEEMTVQLKQLANDSLRKHHNAEITDIVFVFADEELGTYEELSEVVVYLQEAAEGAEDVETIEKVIIDTKSHRFSENDDKIIQLLRDVWELKDKKITVYWEGGTS